MINFRRTLDNKFIKSTPQFCGVFFLCLSLKGGLINLMIDLMHGDCLELMKEIPDESVDLILCDPPYGTIKSLSYNKWKNRKNWDEKIDTELMFKEYERLLKPKAPAIVFSQEPYTSEIRTVRDENLHFAYPMIWNKDQTATPLMAHIKPLGVYEDLSVFYKKYPSLNCDSPLRKYSRRLATYIFENFDDVNTRSDLNKKMGDRSVEHFFRYDSIQYSLPTKKTYEKFAEIFGLKNLDFFIDYDDLVENRIFNNDGKAIKNVFTVKREKERFHPTQKPIALLKQLIELYTNEGMVVLDNCMGSGSTGVACVNTNRNFIGIEKDDDYFKIAKDRIDQAEKDIKLDV